MPHSIAGVMSITRPGETAALPLVLDSPHSGRQCPADMRAVVAPAALRSAEDCYIDELFPGPAHGAVMLAAEFPRAYIDPNRTLADLDGQMLDGDWPEPLRPSNKTAVGKGLIWRTLGDGSPIYDRLLSVAEVRHRIDRYWRPYRRALDELLDEAHARHGAVWHINCHSMPALWPAGVDGAGTPVAADFLIGDRDGSTCEPAFTTLVRDTLAGLGFRVAVNDRFKGVDIVQQCGRPRAGRHSLQIEVVRARYMDETTYQRGERFGAYQRALGALIDAIGEYIGRA